MRRGPSDGYDFSRKRDYRRRVWATFRDRLKDAGVSVSDAHALLMPSKEGDEIEVALNAGFREDHLHVVDSNPAIVATLRRSYDRINTYGVTTSKALERMAWNGISLHAVNLDFCGQLSRAFLRELFLCSVHGNTKAKFQDGGRAYLRYSARGAFSPQCLVAVTMLRGREPTEVTRTWSTNQWTNDRIDAGSAITTAQYGRSAAAAAHADIWKSIPLNDRRRLDGVRRALQMHEDDSDRARWAASAILERAESYPSTNGQTMLWSVWRLLSAPFVIAYAVAVNLGRACVGQPIEPLPSSWLLNKSGQFDGDGALIWRDTLPILRELTVDLGLSDQALCETCELQMGILAPA